MENDQAGYLGKARESLASAESDFNGGRYNSCANRCYYACFQAAVAALIHDDIRPRNDWGQFVGQLINRRKRYATALRPTLVDTFELRHIADYQMESITRIEARRALAQTRNFVEAIEARANI
jgi:uncharacterized protein (UPF0332 family)